jgi:DNA-binding response OmpR family regulator
MSARVLVVDDDSTLVAALRTTLEGAGYQVDSAPNAKQALEQARRAAPQLAVLDVMLDSVGEGVDLARQFRSDPALAGTKLLMLSSINERMGLDLSSSSGDDFLPVDSFLEKPVDPARLLAEARSLLGEEA